MQNDLLLNIQELHTTQLGVQRITRNLSLESCDVVELCKEKITHPDAKIIRKGKNWYIYNDDCVVTVNAYSYTIITAHKI